MRLLAMVLSTVVLVGLLHAADDPRPGSRSAASAGDEKVIRALLGQMGEEWNTHDIKSFVSHFAEDADVVNRRGRWMKGRAEIEKHLVALHTSPFRDHLGGRSSKVEQIRFITADVAVAHERTKEDNGQSIRIYVLQRRGGQWQVQSADILQEGEPAPH
jgi:uncharacterized protein (TIGR02246 family)